LGLLAAKKPTQTQKKIQWQKRSHLPKKLTTLLPNIRPPGAPPKSTTPAP